MVCSTLFNNYKPALAPHIPLALPCTVCLYSLWLNGILQLQNVQHVAVRSDRVRTARAARSGCRARSSWCGCGFGRSGCATPGQAGQTPPSGPAAPAAAALGPACPACWSPSAPAMHANIRSHLTPLQCRHAIGAFQEITGAFLAPRGEVLCRWKGKVCHPAKLQNSIYQRESTSHFSHSEQGASCKAGI